MVKNNLIIFLFLFLAACGGSEYSPYGGTDEPTQVKIGKPYTISGQTYAPKYDATYTEEGMASWYGPKFHGRMTASGERYDKHEMTAAHRTLPMPSIVKVTRLDTGRSVKVRVNDRGPFSKRRIIDLSQAAAEELDMIRIGTARVRVEYLSPDTEDYIASMGLKKPEGWGEPARVFAAVPAGDVTSADLAPPKPLMEGNSDFNSMAPAAQPPSFSFSLVSSAHAADRITPSGRYRIQAGSFGNPQNAERVAGDLRTLGAASVLPVATNGGQFYRVSLGPMTQYEEAERLLEHVRSLGYRDARIMVDDS